VAVSDLIVFSSILMGALILVNLLRLLPQTRGVWQRIRADWTQLSFLLYGGLVISTMLLFDEYHYDTIWHHMAPRGLEFFGAGRVAVSAGERDKAAHPGTRLWRYRGDVDRSSR
jgi:hypothetical protein